MFRTCCRRSPIRTQTPPFCRLTASERSTWSLATQCCKGCWAWKTVTVCFHLSGFYGDPSTFLWEDDLGGVHHIRQGEGGEQGDPLMPMLFSLGQHAALTAIAERLEDGERLLAFLDDLYVVTTPLRSVAVHEVLREELWRHAKISVHHGKTCIWNRGGVVRARVWRGSHEDSLEDQGITILCTPVGRPEFVERELAKILANHRELLTRIPNHLQCAWLLLLYCGAARANFYIRTVRPELTAAFSRGHDEQIWQCFCGLLRIGPDAVAPSAKAAATLPLAAGGMGLTELWRQRKFGKSLSCCKVELMLGGYDGGVLCWHVPQLVLLHSRFWTGIVPQGWTVPRLPCMRCWGDSRHFL